MKQVWELNPQSFEKMLGWLDKDHEIAAQKYEAIRLRLIKVSVIAAVLTANHSLTKRLTG